MITSFFRIEKRTISLILIILLTVVFCGSVDQTCGTSISGGGIKGSGDISVSRSLIAFPSAAVHEDNNGGAGNDQRLEKETEISEIFCRIVKKLLTILGGGLTQGSRTILKLLYISVCIAGYACLFLLTHVRFIHLKDGSK